ncbi:hypothetical protein COT44_03710 [Candidatus Shapirobacteria bacterium CG08_land_8_20_14_0_20_39_18]|uniref:Adenylate kinase n=1 Tax=Candidatus Shapirobacteria bacterium CG08_land_8_20_14_0_20_39_18 TaxID=1974883 RepID=A0A2M6XC94_9BACT|nr:MAG: hypothetical protein COT44_03710 [Candidatus Shapirobacteria bacterium CG08_land_8_20_14_0_20_39_18]PIY64743.1 MAG: hypothetical protein COY91_04385 [Candidatus Shapirobacteria bacterium CG_4_10_14_0_8_um_filter_39_15]PJE67971.1 MAG: hypothetical protein COU94_04370 [Candidatus Shapirobacteria bacterium CG10_big_fil_rev_8_21_14_0_10_38_8]
MKSLEFPLFRTKSPAGSPIFDLSDPAERKKYFEFKAGPEIAKLKKYLADGNTFLAYLLGKKNAGKEIHDQKKKEELLEYLRKDYRGYLDLDQIIEAQVNRTQGALLPTEFILSMIKRKISQVGTKAIFLDGFPRNMDQVSYSLFFRELIGHRDDPDIMVLIDLPQAVVVCPICHTPRSTKLAITKQIEYDQNTQKFYLICEDPNCKGARMVGKPGKAFSLYGIPKILLNNFLPLEKAKEFVDDYEITPEYILSWDEKGKRVKVGTKPWIIKDDKERDSVSLLPAPVLVSLIKQLVDIL